MKKVFLALACAGIMTASLTSCQKQCECTIATVGSPTPAIMDAGKMSKKDCENTKTVGGITEGNGRTITCRHK